MNFLQSCVKNIGHFDQTFVCYKHTLQKGTLFTLSIHSVLTFVWIGLFGSAALLSLAIAFSTPSQLFVSRDDGSLGDSTLLTSPQCLFGCQLSVLFEPSTWALIFSMTHGSTPSVMREVSWYASFYIGAIFLPLQYYLKLWRRYCGSLPTKRILRTY